MAEFGLPSEFLVDDFFSEKHSEVQIKSGRGCRLSPELPGEWEYGSNLSSPGESVTETESSDEEDYMAGLTRQMAHYFLQEEEKNLNHVLPGKTTVPVGSPQSTLYAFSRESSNVPSLVSSPASSPLEQYNGDAWDVLYAASQVVRMKMNDEQPVRGLLGQPTRQTSPPLPKTAAPGSASSALNQNQLLARQFQQLKQEQLFKQQQSVPVWNRQNRTKVVLPRGEISNNRTWPPYPQQHRSGTRAVFLGLSSRRESCGTGVFLPRRVDSPADFRKKPACATVLLPARVVQALNLDLEELSAQSRFSGGFVLDHGAVAMVGRGNGMLLPRQTYRPQATQANSHHRGEIRLPSEWTY